MADRTSGGRGEGELPPDPWAGLADHGATSPPRPPPPQPPTGAGPGWASHPSVTSGQPMGHLPPARRTLWHHPGVWIALLLLAGVLLVGALLEPRSSPPPPPAPDAVTASAVAPGGDR